VNSIYNSGEAPLTEEELAAVRQNATERLSRWRKRALGSAGAFFLCCLLVYLFLDGSPLHAYWEPFGKYLVFLWMALSMVCLYCVTLLWGAWRALRDVGSERI
jgi:hypothetical protein